jgi:hypothetical protein
VPIQNLHSSGEFHKYVNVTTNAKNNPTFKLSIGGNYRPLVEFDPNNLRLSGKKGNDTGAVLTIKTIKKDLKILDVQFKENGKELDWKANVPITYSLSQDTAKPKKDTVKVKKAAADAKQPAAQKMEDQLMYKLRVNYVPSSQTDIYGEFVIKTNIKENSEIKVSGVLEAKHD